jgi:PAS domain S-box-containing protein
MAGDVKRFRLTKKLFSAFLICAGLPLLAASVIYFSVFYSLSREVAGEILSEKTRTVSLLLAARMDSLYQRLSALASENAITINTELKLAPAVSVQLRETIRTDSLDAIEVWDDAGTLFAGASRDGAAIPPPVYPKSAARQTIAGTYASTAGDGSLYLQATHSLNSGSGKNLGLISARVGFGSLCSAISSEISSPVVVLDASRRVIAMAGMEGRLQTSAFRALKGPEGLSAAGLAEGKAFKMSFAPIRGPDPWVLGWIGSAYSMDRIDARKNGGSILLVIVMVGILGACILMSLYFSKTITEPVRALAGTARKMAQGTYGLVAPYDQDDEIGDLSKDFNSMSKALSDQLRELESTRSYLDNVVNSLPSGLVGVNPEGEITEWNAAAETLTGKSKEEAIGRKIWEMIPFLKEGDPRLAEVVKDREPRSLLRGSIRPGDGRGGASRYVDVSLFPLVHNCVEGAVYRFDDVTELEQKENQLRQAQKMEMLGNLTSGIAHDFNNILMGIMGTASILSLALDDPSPPGYRTIKEDVDSIISISGRARNLVKQLIGLSRRQEVSLKRMDLSETIDSVLKICRTSFDKSISISVDFPEGPAIALADPTLIEQVALNICVNASHAMTVMRPEGQPRGGKLSISLERFLADAHFCSTHPLAVECPYWVLRFGDSGVGIEPEVLPKIFDPFFTTKPMGQGSGLGLSTTYSIVRQHDGFIDVYSAPGTGTVFSVYLPDRSDKATEDGGGQEAESIVRGEGAVMVLDDEAPIRRIAASMLQRCGYTPVAAETVQEAATLLSESGRAIKALVLDMSMPKVSGDEAFSILRAQAPWLKVLIASGYRNDPRIDALLSKGALGYIQKPYTIHELSRALGKIVGDSPDSSSAP